ncbi:MAG TPA: hypothetical protein VFE88_00590 [Candidatus Nanoarchaeia archaeon]|nr:hypothetical protein [Candidatus Nanoarchaeia archaeon]
MISNSSPLIALTKVGLLTEAKKLYSSLEVPEVVFNESILAGLESGKQDAIILNALYKEGFIKKIKLDKKHAEISKKIETEYHLDQGEAEVLALALQLNQKTILLDEALGRNVAELFELTPKGSLRVILECYNQNLITEEKVYVKVGELVKILRIDSEVLTRLWDLFEIAKKKKTNKK